MMERVGWQRRLAAWVSLPLLLVAVAILVQALYRNVLALTLGLPGLAITISTG